MEEHRQCSRLVGRDDWRGKIDSAHSKLGVGEWSWKGWMARHRQCSRLVGRGEWKGIDSAHR